MSAIFADAWCDLDATQVKKLNIHMVGLDKKQPYQESFVSAFQPYLDEEEDIIYFATNLSKVKDEFDKTVKYFSGLYENRIIKAIDLNSLSVCAGLIIYEVGLMYKRGSTDIEILKFVESFKDEVYGLFISQNKDLISKCYGTEKINSNSTLNLISPIILATKMKLDILDKAQGKKRAINIICNIVKENCVNIADYPLIVGYNKDQVNAEYLKNNIIKQLGEDTVVLLQKFSNESVEIFGDNALFISFYSKKIR